MCYEEGKKKIMQDLDFLNKNLFLRVLGQKRMNLDGCLGSKQEIKQRTRYIKHQMGLPKQSHLGKRQSHLEIGSQNSAHFFTLSNFPSF